MLIGLFFFNPLALRKGQNSSTQNPGKLDMAVENPPFFNSQIHSGFPHCYVNLPERKNSFKLPNPRHLGKNWTSDRRIDDGCSKESIEVAIARVRNVILVSWICFLAGETSVFGPVIFC